MGTISTNEDGLKNEDVLIIWRRPQKWRQPQNRELPRENEDKRRRPQRIKMTSKN